MIFTQQEIQNAGTITQAQLQDADMIVQAPGVVRQAVLEAELAGLMSTTGTFLEDSWFLTNAKVAVEAVIAETLASLPYASQFGSSRVWVSRKISPLEPNSPLEWKLTISWSPKQ